LLHTIAYTQDVAATRIASADTLLIGINDTSSIARLLKNIHPADKRNPDSTLPFYRQTIRLSRQLSYRRGLMLSLYYAANIYAEQGKYALALSLYKEALPLCYTPDNEDYLASIYNGIACIYQYTYDYGQSARYLYKAAFEGRKANAEFSYAGIYNNLGFMLSKIGRQQQCFYYLNKAEELARNQKGQELLMSGISLNKGTIYVDMGKPDSGAYYLQRSLNIATQHNLVVLKKIALINLGNIYMSSDSNEKALRYFTEAKQINGHINPIYSNAGNAMMGGCYCALGQYDKGFPLMLSALEEAQQLGLGQNLLHINQMLSECYALKKDYTNAYKYHAVYDHLRDSMENRSRDELVNQYEVKYRTAEKSRALTEKELYISRQDNYLKKTRLVIAGIGILSLLLGITTLSLYRSRRQRNTMQAQQLQLLQQQQKIDQFKAVMEGEEKERTRIARELHDGLGGMMAAVKMNYSMLQNRYEQLAAANPQIDIQDFDEIHEMLDEVNNELRRTAYNLMPAILSMHGIAEALKMYIEPINTYKHLYINLQINGRPDIADKFFELSLYRIIQELVQNVIKHAEATNTLIQLTFSDDRITLMVKDNGKGFDVAHTGSGLGLKNVEFRVQSFGGEMSVTSSASTGTSIVIKFDRSAKDEPGYE
jgi:signal transduction histidine kinase